MPRKPAHKAVPHLDSREAVWAAIRERREGFTVGEVRDETRLGYDTVSDYVQGLYRAGYLEAAGTVKGPGGRWLIRYRLVRDVGAEAPRVRRDGTPVTMGLSREQMWRTMRILGTFTALDLAVHASTEEHPVSEVDAQDYAYHLAKAGYLKESGKARPFRYLFVTSRFTGPLPPQIQRVKQVWDPNLRRVVWPLPGTGRP